jgi:hypothetical protein
MWVCFSNAGNLGVCLLLLLQPAAAWSNERVIGQKQALLALWSHSPSPAASAAAAAAADLHLCRGAGGGAVHHSREHKHT